jgi:nucleotide-binding universal stress UspA family protein
MTKSYKRILVPYDGSKYSKKAIEVAIEMARKFDSDLYFLTVMDKIVPPTLISSIDAGDEQKLIKYLKTTLSKIELVLRDEVLRCKEHGVYADYEIIKGQPANTIIKFTKKRKIDLIVIGSKGLSGLQKLKALGSTSRKISELASCPVLIIR